MIRRLTAAADSAVIIALSVAEMLTLCYSDNTDSGMTVEQHSWF